jgi:HEAT repeat protein
VNGGKGPLLLLFAAAVVIVSIFVVTASFPEKGHQGLDGGTEPSIHPKDVLTAQEELPIPQLLANMPSSWSKISERLEAMTAIDKEALEKLVCRQFLGSEGEGQPHSVTVIAAGLLGLSDDGILNRLDEMSRIEGKGLFAHASIALGILSPLKADALVSPLFTHPSPDIRVAACEAARFLNQDWVWPLLRNSLEDQKAEVRATALDAFARASVRAGIRRAAVLKAASEGPDKTRCAAVRLIGQLGIESGLDILARTARQGNTDLRIETARALGKIKDSRSPEILRSLLEDEDVEVKTEALRSIAKVGETSDADAVAFLLSHPSPSVRSLAVEVALALRSEGLPSKIEHLVRDEADEVRKALLRFLEKSRAEKADLLLVGLLTDPVREIADQAAEILASRKAGPVVGACVQSLSSREAGYGRTVRLLSRVTGQSFGHGGEVDEKKRQSVVSCWRLWWKKNKGKY